MVVLSLYVALAVLIISTTCTDAQRTVDPDRRRFMGWICKQRRKQQSDLRILSFTGRTDWFEYIGNNAAS